MKFFTHFILIFLIRVNKTQKLNYSFVNSDENEFDVGFDVYEDYYNERIQDKPVLDLVELMKQPPLPGIADENWPYPEDVSPFSQYNKDGCIKCECGAGTRKRIVNGKLAKRNEFPWQVLITYKRRFNCGGSLINDRYVLTAGHCVKGYKKGTLELRFGAFKKSDRAGVYRKIQQIWIANGFNINTLNNDAAVIRLESKIRITRDVKPICLPVGNSNYGGKMATVTGWGALYFGGPPSEVLKKAHVPVLTNEQCRKTGYSKKIRPTHVCAGNNGYDACSGDSGGPLIVSDQNRFRQIGIVSFGKGCNKPNYPGVYTRVTTMSRFIKNMASRDTCWCT